MWEGSPTAPDSLSLRTGLLLPYLEGESQEVPKRLCVTMEHQMAYCAVVIMSYEQEEFVPFHVRLGERVWDVQLECSKHLCE